MLQPRQPVQLSPTGQLPRKGTDLLPANQPRQFARTSNQGSTAQLRHKGRAITRLLPNTKNYFFILVRGHSMPLMTIAMKKLLWSALLLIIASSTLAHLVPYTVDQGSQI